MPLVEPQDGQGKPLILLNQQSVIPSSASIGKKEL